MGKVKRFAIFVCMLAICVASLFGCVLPKSDGVGDGKDQTGLDSYTGINDKIVDFSKNDGKNMFIASNGYGNGGMFDCLWSGNNVVRDEAAESLRLKLTKDGDKIYGSEFRSYATYGYGYYSVRMKAIKRSGVISSFFMYTNRPQWDEIDIEFLGKDTTVVQFNYFTNGAGGHEYIYNLGFDASTGFHEYAYKWEEGRLTWYVDGKGVYSATANIPSHEGRIMLNVWNGKSDGANNVVSWVGAFDKSAFPVPDAEYKWIGYKSI